MKRHLHAVAEQPSLPTVRCVGCGKFIADADLERSHYHFEPLNEFGPEVAEWTCRRCCGAS